MPTKNEAYKMLNQAAWSATLPLRTSDKSKLVTVGWEHDTENKTFIIKKSTVNRKYSRKLLTYSSHDWKKERPFYTSGWTVVSDIVETLFVGKGSEALLFLESLASKQSD